MSVVHEKEVGLNRKIWCGRKSCDISPVSEFNDILHGFSWSAIVVRAMNNKSVTVIKYGIQFIKY